MVDIWGGGWREREEKKKKKKKLLFFEGAKDVRWTKKEGTKKK